MGAHRRELILYWVEKKNYRKQPRAENGKHVLRERPPHIGNGDILIIYLVLLPLPGAVTRLSTPDLRFNPGIRGNFYCQVSEKAGSGCLVWIKDLRDKKELKLTAEHFVFRREKADYQNAWALEFLCLSWFWITSSKTLQLIKLLN